MLKSLLSFEHRIKCVIILYTHTSIQDTTSVYDDWLHLKTVKQLFVKLTNIIQKTVIS